MNIPYYPLLRRDVDCIIALDASADSQVCVLIFHLSLKCFLNVIRTCGSLELNVSWTGPLRCVEADRTLEDYAFSRGLTTWPKGARWPALLQPQGTESGSVANNSDGTGRATEAESAANRALAARKKRSKRRIKRQGTLTQSEGDSLITQNKLNQQIELEIKQARQIEPVVEQIRSARGGGIGRSYSCSKCGEQGHKYPQCPQHN